MPQLVTCPLCEQQDFRLLWKDNDVQIVKCRKCRFIYRNPQPTKEELDRIYDAYYVSEEAHLKNSCTFRLPVFENGIKALKQVTWPGKLLDVGCGAGEFVRLAREADWEASGVELSSPAAAYARKQGLDVKTGTLAD